MEEKYSLFGSKRNYCLPRAAFAIVRIPRRLWKMRVREWYENGDIIDLGFGGPGHIFLLNKVAGK